jgi:hypothetical protein
MTEVGIAFVHSTEKTGLEGKLRRISRQLKKEEKGNNNMELLEAYRETDGQIDRWTDRHTNTQAHRQKKRRNNYRKRNRSKSCPN